MANISSTRTEDLAMPPPSFSPNLDPATLLGVSGAFVVIGLAMYLGGSIDSFFNLPSVLIVVIGTFLVTMISFSLQEVVRSQSVMFRAAIYNIHQPEQAALQVIYLADYARKRGKLALQQVIDDFSHNEFLHRAMTMVVDGMPTEQIEAILSRETEATHLRHLRSAGVLRRAGEIAPAMGLIGTPGRPGTDAGTTGRPLDHRAQYGGCPAHHILRGNPGQHGLHPAGHQAGPQLADRSRGESYLYDRGGIYQPPGKPKAPGDGAQHHLTAPKTG